MTLEISGQGAQWTNKIIAGYIPSVTGVVEQSAKLYVLTSNNAKSNEWPILFPATETKLLPQSAVKLVSCGTDSNKDVCNGWVDPDDGAWFSSSCGHTYYGWHMNCWGCIGNDEDTDVFEITLKNGWFFQSVQTEVIVDPGEGYALGPSGFPQGGTYWKPQIQWNVTSGDDLCHGAYVYVTGPKGVPYN